MVIQQLRPLSGIDFGYTRESVEWLEGYIERQRNSGELDNVGVKNKLVSVFGSFLGECVVHCYGGTWRQDEEGVWCVAFNDDNMVFPFAKVAKQMDNGLEDGIVSFFTVIPIIFKKLPRAVPSTPALPPDVRRGLRLAAQFEFLIGLCPWFGLCPNIQRPEAEPGAMDRLSPSD